MDSSAEEARLAEMFTNTPLKRPNAFEDSWFLRLPRDLLRIILLHAFVRPVEDHDHGEIKFDENGCPESAVERSTSSQCCIVLEGYFVKDGEPLSGYVSGSLVSNALVCGTATRARIKIANVCSIFRETIRSFNPSIRVSNRLDLFYDVKSGDGFTWTSTSLRGYYRAGFKEEVLLASAQRRISKRDSLRDSRLKVKRGLIKKMRETTAIRKMVYKREKLASDYFAFPFVPPSEVKTRPIWKMHGLMQTQPGRYELMSRLVVRAVSADKMAPR